jgi:phospholipid/cholesterol/gamma-HCH transport system substrate-binding protein
VKRTGHVPFMQLRIGIFVVAAAALLVWATFQSGSFRLGKEETLSVQFPSVGGLEEGAVVRLNGVPVGVVRDIGLVPNSNNVLVKLGVKRGTRARLHEGATARITTVGFLSELYVEIYGGELSEPLITSDAEIQVVAATDPNLMMGKATGIADSLQILLGDLNSAGRSIARGRGTMGRLAKDDRLYEELVTFTHEATLLTRRLNTNQALLTERFGSLATSLDSLTQLMQHGDGTMAQLMRNGELYRNLAQSTARMDSVFAMLQSGRGSMGLMMTDPRLYNDMAATMASMRRLMAEIEKNPKKYLKFSVF